jgi:hypothetical protein
MDVIVRWIAMKKALAFVRRLHRHLPRLQGGIVALGMWVDGALRGVAILGRPARMDAPNVVQVSRVCTDGIPNGCSKLYAKCKRVGEALGFTVVKTFTREDEPGSSLFAVQAQEDGLTDGEGWSRPSRKRNDVDLVRRRRWIL